MLERVRFSWKLTSVPEIVRAFPQLDDVESLSDGTPEGFPCSCGDIPQLALDLRKHMLDRVQVRAVRRQEEHVRPGGADRLIPTGSDTLQKQH